MDKPLQLGLGLHGAQGHVARASVPMVLLPFILSFTGTSLGWAAARGGMTQQAG